MNPNTNEFEQVKADTPAEWPRFDIGETVNVKGVDFKVEAIWPKGIVLTPIRTGPSVDVSHLRSRMDELIAESQAEFEESRRVRRDRDDFSPERIAAQDGRRNG